MQKRFIHRNLTQNAILPGLAGSRHVTLLEAEANNAGKTVLLGAVCSHVPAQPAARQSFSYTVIGELQAGGKVHVYV